MKNYLETEILPMDDRLELRGIGLIWGIEFKNLPDGSALSKAVSRKCFDNGLVIERAGRGDSVVKPLPALTIPDEDLTKGLRILKDAVAEVLQG